jgi:hypothetical protein
MARSASLSTERIHACTKACYSRYNRNFFVLLRHATDHGFPRWVSPVIGQLGSSSRVWRMQPLTQFDDRKSSRNA